MMTKKVFFSGVLFLLMLFAGNLEAASNESLEKRIEKLEERERSKYKKGESEILVYFKNGFKMRSRDNQFKFQAGGRIMHDWGSFAENQKFEQSMGNQENGARFRRVRFFMAGMLYNQVKFMWDIDVDGGANGVTFKDMYISFPRIPVLGNFQVGHFKRPASLDSVTSSKYLTFLERSLANTFFKTRNVGFAFFNQHFNKRLTWFTFANKETSERPPDFTIDGDWNVTSRLTGLPYISEDYRRWLHLGLSWSHENATNNKVTFRGARDSEITSTFLTTGELEAETFNIIGLEGAYNWNQFGIQGEYVLTDIERKAGGNGLLDAFYVQGSWYLTGENRRYYRKNGAIARFRPNQNFSWDKKWSEGNGTGALQLAVRYSELDLNDSGAGIAGGEQKSLTLGLNWELNPVSRIMYNFVHAKFSDGTGADSGKLISNLVRFQVDF
ncbi:MAG: porin [Nitrospinaceae bacterium]|jgi:phosphate-selective porin OprO/OprP|nr:porin [Nitrospinaceae bacterium]